MPDDVADLQLRVSPVKIFRSLVSNHFVRLIYFLRFSRVTTGLLQLFTGFNTIAYQYLQNHHVCACLVMCLFRRNWGSLSIWPFSWFGFIVSFGKLNIGYTERVNKLLFTLNFFSFISVTTWSAVKTFKVSKLLFLQTHSFPEVICHIYKERGLPLNDLQLK